MHLNRSQTLVLQALRAAPMESAQLSERFRHIGYRAPLGALLDKGLVCKSAETEYAITELGRKVCPVRNKKLAKAAP